MKSILPQLSTKQNTRKKLKTPMHEICSKNMPMHTIFRRRKTTSRTKEPSEHSVQVLTRIKKNTKCVQLAPICLYKILISDVFIIIILLIYWWIFSSFFFFFPVRVGIIYECLLKSDNFNTASIYVCVCLYVADTYPILISFSHSVAAAAAVAIDSIIWYPVVWWIGDTINIWLWLSALILAITGDGVHFSPSLPSLMQHNEQKEYWKCYSVRSHTHTYARTCAHEYVVNIWARSNAQHLLAHFRVVLQFAVHTFPMNFNSHSLCTLHSIGSEWSVRCAWYLPWKQLHQLENSIRKIMEFFHLQDLHKKKKKSCENANRLEPIRN